MRAVVYPRVSSVMQREEGTIDSQLRALPEFVARQGWTLARPAGAYADDGRSASSGAGKLEARHGLAALLRDAAAGAFDVVVVADVDRLARSEDLEERGRILGTLQRAGVKIASQMSGQLLDLSTSSGDLFTTLHAFFAAEWVRKHRERIVQGRITAAQRGRLPAGRPPWGLAYDRATGAWSIDPVRGPLVVEMFERATAGESCRAIADDLDARGVQRERGRWHRSRVAAIIRSRYPVGEWTADERRGLAIAVPRIVSDELWQRAQDEISKVGHRTRGLRHTKHEYLLEGLAVCGSCGTPIGIRTPDAYICGARRAARKGSGDRCMAPIVQVAEADARAWTAIRRELEDPALDAAIAGELSARAADRHDWEADAAGYRRKLERLQDVEGKLLARFTRGSISEAAMDTELARIARERAALHDQLETAGRASAAATATTTRLRDAGAILAQLRERLADAPFQVQRALVQRLVQPGGIVFRGEDIRITLRVPRAPAAARTAVSSVENPAC